MTSEDAVIKLLKTAEKYPEYITDDPRKAYVMGVLDHLNERKELSTPRHSELRKIVLDYEFEGN